MTGSLLHPSRSFNLRLWSTICLWIRSIPAQPLLKNFATSQVSAKDWSNLIKRSNQTAENARRLIFSVLNVLDMSPGSTKALKPAFCGVRYAFGYARYLGAPTLEFDFVEYDMHVDTLDTSTAIAIKRRNKPGVCKDI
jgi:hypothetical protein